MVLQGQLVPPERGDPLDLLVPLASLVVRGVSALLGQWERRANQVKKVQLALLDAMENKGLWDYLDLLGHRAHLEMMETRYNFNYFILHLNMLILLLIYVHNVLLRGRQVDQGRKAAKETKEKEVPPGHLGAKDLLDSQDHQVWMESQGSGDSKGCMALKVMKVHAVLKVQLDHQGCRECQDPLERREKVAMLDLWALQDNMVHAAPREPLEERVLRACRAQWASQEWWEKRVRMGKLAIQEMWEKLAWLEKKVRWVRRGMLAPLGLQDPPESEAYLDQMDPKETQDPLDSLVTLDPLESQVLMALMVDLELKGIMENLVNLDPKAPRESLALQDPLDEGVI